MYFIRTAYCPYRDHFTETHFYDNDDEPIIRPNGRPNAYTHRGPALIQELQTVIQYCDDCALKPAATRYLKLGIPLDKFLEYCDDKDYANELETIIGKLLDKCRRAGEKGQMTDRAEVERDEQHFRQAMVPLQADGKRMLRGEDLGRRKRKGETVKKLQKWLRGIGRGRQQHPDQVPDTAPSTSVDAGYHMRVNENNFWVGVPDPEEDEGHQDEGHHEEARQYEAHDDDAHQDEAPQRHNVDAGTTQTSILELRHEVDGGADRMA